MKKKGFSLLEVAIAGALFSLSILLIQQFVVSSLQIFSLRMENVLQQTQNFFFEQTLLTVPESLNKQITWQINTSCNTNFEALSCTRYQLQLPNGQIVTWYKYAR